MRRFDETVRADEASLRFYSECQLCGERRYSSKIPVLCRSKKALALCSAGEAGKLRQALYDRARESAAENLSLYFNRCPVCGKWVCDDCFDIGENGACCSCAKKNF